VVSPIGSEDLSDWTEDRQRAILYRNNPNNPSSLSAGGVMTLMQDRDHRIWVSTDPGTVDRFDPRSSSFRT